jgi:hypothetical protein
LKQYFKLFLFHLFPFPIQPIFHAPDQLLLISQK